MKSVESFARPEEGLRLLFDWSANSKTVSEDVTLHYVPPAFME